MFKIWRQSYTFFGKYTIIWIIFLTFVPLIYPFYEQNSSDSANL